MNRSRFRRVATLTVAALLIGGAAAGPLFADESTVSVNALRTGWDANEPALSPALVPHIKQLFDRSVDGQVFAQPIVVGSTVITATETNHVYGLNAATGAVKWSRSLGAAWPASAIGCGDLTPTIGVTSTPVYDPASGNVYLVSEDNNGKDVQHPNWYVHALSAATGAERSGWPVRVSGAPTNDPTRPFNSFTAMQRPGLLLMGGSVYAGFASHCDIGPYNGYLLGVNTSTRKQTLWTTEKGAADGKGGIWMSGGGPVSDGPGRIFFSTGNGLGPAAAAYNHPPTQLGDAVVQLGVNSNGTLSARQFFSPANAPTLNANDTDLGSGGPAALPQPYFGTSRFPHLLVQVGKDGRVFLLNRDNLGGRSTTTDHVLGVTRLSGGVWGHPGVWGGDGGYVYILENKTPGRLIALKYGATSAGVPTLTKAGSSAQSFGYTSGSPVVTSNGATAGSAVIWVEYNTHSYGTGKLFAYKAVPVNGVLQPIFSTPLPLGAMTKFQVPATANGRVYVGTNGHLIAFG